MRSAPMLWIKSLCRCSGFAPKNVFNSVMIASRIGIAQVEVEEGCWTRKHERIPSFSSAERALTDCRINASPSESLKDGYG
jgi:hypothetical protein